MWESKQRLDPALRSEGVALLENARPTDLAVAQFRNRVIHPEQYRDDEQEKIAASVIELIEHVLETHYDTVIRKPKRGAYGEYLNQSKEKELPTVSQRTFYAASTAPQNEVSASPCARGGASRLPFQRVSSPRREDHQPSRDICVGHGSY